MVYTYVYRIPSDYITGVIRECERGWVWRRVESEKKSPLDVFRNFFVRICVTRNHAYYIKNINHLNSLRKLIY